jgi:exodeoxyribonuclease VIII
VKTAAKWRYHVQAAYYSDGYRAAFGEAPKGFAFIAVEKDPPFMVAFYVASEAMTLRGRLDYKADLATFDRCRATDTWPALSDSPIIIDLPKWA